MAKETPDTVVQEAPLAQAYVAPQPRPKTIERQGDISAPMTVKYPDVYGGQCEACGVMDPLVPSYEQYKMCPHYRNLLGGASLRCSYCPPEKEPNGVIYHSRMRVYQDPRNPDVIIACCDNPECMDKHFKRFTTHR